MAAVARTHVAEASQSAQSGLDRRHNGQSLTSRGDDGFLNDARGFVNPQRQIGDQPVDLLSLGRGQSHGAGRLLGNGVCPRDQRANLLVHRLEHLLRNLNFLDSPNALIWPAGAGVGGIFLLRQHFQSIPKELEEAAVVDGAGRFRVYWQICLPLVKGTLIALGIFTFLGSWNDLFWPLIVLSDRNHLTLPAGLAILGQGNYQQRGITMAAAVIASLPPFILYIIFQRQIVAGISTTGLAGR